MALQVRNRGPGRGHPHVCLGRPGWDIPPARRAFRSVFRTGNAGTVPRWQMPTASPFVAPSSTGSTALDEREGLRDSADRRRVYRERHDTMGIPELTQGGHDGRCPDGRPDARLQGSALSDADRQAGEGGQGTRPRSGDPARGDGSGAIPDVAAWSRTTGNPIVSQDKAGAVMRFWIQKA